VAREILSVLQISSIRVVFIIVQSLRLLRFSWSEGFWPAAFPSAGPGGVESCLGALLDDVPLELGEGAEDVEDKFSA
jgi:hypothetical protein